MIHRRKARAFGLSAMGVLALSPLPALAQGQYPTKAIRLVVPFSPGGVVDTIGRLWVDKAGPLLGTIIVDNRGGAGGALGAAEVARSAPDGYTLLLGNTSTQVLQPATMLRPTYNPAKEFVSAAIIATSATSIIVHPSMPVRNVKQLIAYAKANPGKLSYGSAGAGTLTNLGGEMFKQLAGNLDIVHVPYKGAGPGIGDLVGGYIPMMAANVTGHVLSLHRAGKLRILSVNAPRRLKAAPEIPATIETVPNMVAELFSGVFAPAGTPKGVVERISQVTRKALTDQSFQQILMRSGFEPVLDSSPERAQRYVDKEQERLLPVLKKVGFKSS